MPVEKRAASASEVRAGGPGSPGGSTPSRRYRTGCGTGRDGTTAVSAAALKESTKGKDGPRPPLANSHPWGRGCWARWGCRSSRQARPRQVLTHGPALSLFLLIPSNPPSSPPRLPPGAAGSRRCSPAVPLTMLPAGGDAG